MSGADLTEQQVRDRLQAACNAAGSQAAYAAANGLNPAVVSATLHALRAPGPAVLRALGLRSVTRFAELRKTVSQAEG